MAGDIFYTLKQLENENYTYFASMPEESLKEVSPFLVLMWLQGASANEGAITILADTFVNENFHAFYKHPRLQMLMLCSAIGGVSGGRYTFKKAKKDKDHDDLTLLMREFSVNIEVAKDYLSLLDEESIDALRSKYKEKDGKAK